MKIGKRVAADNVPEELMKRLIGASERDMVGVSAEVRKCLDEALPPFKQVKKFYDIAVQKYHVRNTDAA